MTDIVEQAARVAYETYHKAGEFRPYEIAQALADAGLLREPVTTILEEFVVPCAKCNPDEGRCLPCREEADTYYRAAINAISTYSAAKELARDGDSDTGGYVGRDLRELAEHIKQHLLEHPEPPARTVPTREELTTTIMRADRDPHSDYTPQADAAQALLAGQPTVAEVKAAALEEAAEIVETHRQQRRETIGPIDEDTMDPLLIQAHDSGSDALMDAKSRIIDRAQKQREGEYANPKPGPTHVKSTQTTHPLTYYL